MTIKTIKENLVAMDAVSQKDLDRIANERMAALKAMNAERKAKEKAEYLARKAAKKLAAEQRYAKELADAQRRADERQRIADEHFLADYEARQRANHVRQSVERKNKALFKGMKRALGLR